MGYWYLHLWLDRRYCRWSREREAVAGVTSPTGAPVTAVQVAPGGTIAGTGADFIVLSQGSFLNAAAVAGALASGSYTITHSALGATVEADFLLAYAGLDGNTHIADLHLAAAGGPNPPWLGNSTHTNTDLVTVTTWPTWSGSTSPRLPPPPPPASTSSPEEVLDRQVSSEIKLTAGGFGSPSRYCGHGKPSSVGRHCSRAERIEAGNGCERDPR